MPGIRNTVVLVALVSVILFSQANSCLVFLHNSYSPVNEPILSVNFAHWSDHCDSTSGWEKQYDADAFPTPVGFTSEGDLIVYPIRPYSLCFDNFPFIEMGFQGPLYVKDIGFSFTLKEMGLFLVQMELQYDPQAEGGLYVYLFDSDGQLAVGFSMIDDDFDYHVAAKISYYEPGNSIRDAWLDYESQYYREVHEFSIGYDYGSGGLFAVIDITTRVSEVILQPEDFDSSREIRYIGVQGHCVPYFPEYEELYRLDEIELTYQTEFSTTSSTSTTTTMSTPPADTTGSNSSAPSWLRATLLLGVSAEIMIIAILIVYKKMMR